MLDAQGFTARAPPRGWCPRNMGLGPIFALRLQAFLLALCNSLARRGAPQEPSSFSASNTKQSTIKVRRAQEFAGNSLAQSRTRPWPATQFAKECRLELVFEIARLWAFPRGAPSQRDWGSGALAVSIFCICFRLRSEGVWRNGSASDSRSENWEFEFLCPYISALAFSILRARCYSRQS